MQTANSDTNQNLANIRNRLDVQDIVSVSNHNWFNPELKEKAIDAVEAFCLAVHNNIPRVMEDYWKQAVSIRNLDKSEYAIATARRQGIDAKLFSILEEEPVSPKIVKSSQFDWAVKSIDTSNEAVPVFALRNLSALRQAGVVFDSLAVASPYHANYLAPGFVLGQESQTALIQAYELGKSLLREVYKVPQKTAAATASAATTALTKIADAAEAKARPPKKFVKDPVLLGCFGDSPCFLIEIARWE